MDKRKEVLTTPLAAAVNLIDVWTVLPTTEIYDRVNAGIGHFPLCLRFVSRQ
jgi:hypothetical protein